MSRFSTLILHIDGSVEGNPGPGAIGVVIEDGQGTPVEAWGDAIGHCTNNQAEYQALLAALRKSRRLGAKHVTVCSDSQLLVRQFLGEYKVRDAKLKPLHAQFLGEYKVRDAKLKPLHEEARRLARAFESFEIVHIPREQNRAADRLANRARLAQ